jgi:hypothetical protein
MARDAVRLRLPAEPRYARVARLTAAALATAAGFDHDEVDDLRGAIADLCAELFVEGATGHVDLVFDLDRETMRVEATRTTDGATGEVVRQHVAR